MSETTCSKCGHEMQIGDYPFCPHESIYAQSAQRFDPIVIHRDASGNVRLPASPDSPVPSGYQKVELTNVHEVRKFEREMNQRSRAEWEQNKAREHATFDPQRQERQAELRAAMRHMSQFGRDFAQLAMDRSNKRPEKGYEPGFVVDVFSNNSSNREAYRDASTGWRGSKK